MALMSRIYFNAVFGALGGLLGWMLFSVFGALALIVATIGVYSVAAYGMSQRTHEMSVRIPLGACA